MRGRRDVRLIVGAVGVSALGDFLLWVPLTLHLQRMGASGLVREDRGHDFLLRLRFGLVAGLFLALWTPIVVLAPVAGLVVDRSEARTVLIVASLGQAAVAASLTLVLGSTGGIPPSSRWCRRSRARTRS